MIQQRIPTYQMDFDNIQYDNNLLGLGLLMSDNLEFVHLFLKNPTNVRITEMVVRLILIMLLFAWLLRYVCMCCSTQHLREQLEEAESEIIEQGHEIDELRKELEIVKQELENYKELVDGVEAKYLNCREAAKRFIETHPECDTIG